ncbi:MAG: Hsp20/alpha crystallin family protein [Verrucomicrobia bacterium]|nr:Hsp20/alpha crystallin family protein [Verrucomicrobiota bacterium]
MKHEKDKSLGKIDHKDAELTRDAQVFVPATDIFEKDDVILVRCDMPGVAQDQIDIRLDDTELEITGTQAKAGSTELGLLVGEYETGVLRRKFSLSQHIDRDRIKARLAHGVLDIELPKAEKVKPRKIEIAVGA